MQADEPTENTPFTITSPELAAWAVDKVLSARERAARIKANCDALIAEAEQDACRAEAYFVPLLTIWARENPPANGKTIKLPTGRVSFRTVPGGPRIVDPDAALAWAKAHLPGAVQVKEAVSALALKTYVEQTGELPNGVEQVESREVFDVKDIR